ncbi:MAG: hypothetical protein PHQ42_01725 [Patescibacteria group bacterium]|nr:hypothetical protein [Patescibacteria group bacterium]
MPEIKDLSSELKRISEEKKAVAEKIWEADQAYDGEAIKIHLGNFDRLSTRESEILARLKKLQQARK